MKHVVPMPLGQRHKLVLLDSRVSLGGFLPTTLLPFCSLGMLDSVLCLPASGSSGRPFPVTSSAAIQIYLGLPPSVLTPGRYYVITSHCTRCSADSNDSCVVLCLPTLCPTINCLRMGFISLCLFTLPSQHLAHCQHVVDTQ